MSERERLVSASNGGSFSHTLEVDGRLPLSQQPPQPLSPRSPRSPVSPEAEHRLRLRAVAAACIFALLLATMAALLAATVMRCRREGGAGCLIPQKLDSREWGGSSLWPPKKRVARLGFGSCAAYDDRAQPLWEASVIPAQPDAWVWLGDFFYADEPAFSCSGANANASQCQCEADWLKAPPHMCMAGDLDNARERMIAQVHQPGYQSFLRFMCPAAFQSSPPGGEMVPSGDDLSACARPVLGTYDDHDFGVNNLNRRLPQKHLFKQIFLDGLGVPPASPRRSSHTGIQWRYSLNPGTPEAVDLFLLDERYERAPLPCEVRQQWCERADATGGGDTQRRAWCADFLNSGGQGERGSCCKADQAVFNAWCKEASNRQDPLWEAACDPRSPAFGSQALAVQADGSLSPRDVTFAEQAEEDSSLCEVLGLQQRAWLDGALAASAAVVKVVVSGSVLFGSTPLEEPAAANDWEGRCSGDDWDCYRPAQLSLLHSLQRHARGACVVVLTGDYHYSDIKVAKPGSGQPYSEAYQTADWTTPIYQVMASGLTNSTARPDAACAGYRKESAGLRIEGECGFVKQPSWGMLEFDWQKRQLSMQIRKAEAPDAGAVLQQLTISLATCQPV